jgi:hypothetical protein
MQLNEDVGEGHVVFFGEIKKLRIRAGGEGLFSKS